MSDEPLAGPTRGGGGWSLEVQYVLGLMREKDLRDQQRFDAQQIALRDALSAQEKAVAAALNAAEQAVRKAETAAEKRFDNVNEFRAQLGDQAATLMPRSEATVLLNALGERLTAVERRLNQEMGRGVGREDSRAVVFAVLGALVAVAALVIAVIR